MKDIPFKAVAIDMDGTFVNDDLTYDRARFKNILTELNKRHIHFIASSGRCLARLKCDFAGFLDNVDMIADNGVLMTQDNKMIYSHFFTYQTGIELLDFMQSEYPTAHMAISCRNHAYLYLDKKMPDDFRSFMHIQYPGIIDITNLKNIPPDDRIGKLTLNFPAEKANEIEKCFNKNHKGKIHCTTSGYDDIDVVCYGVDKAKALKYLLHYLKAKPSELIAFGDGLNDQEILQLAGRSYAMANGDERIKELADYQAPSNDDSGVLKVLEDYLK